MCYTAVHDVTADEFFSICEEAGLELRREPRDIFARALPPAALVAAPGQGRPAIIPDASVRASLSRRHSRAALIGRHATGCPCAVFSLIGRRCTRARHATSLRGRETGRAVQWRSEPASAAGAPRVPPPRTAAGPWALLLYHPQASPPVTITPGPVDQVMLDHDRVRGVVIGGG